MLFIFLYHSGLLIGMQPPVTFFFILSGFVLYYSYSSKIHKITIYENIKWVKKRMKKLYLIHVITLIISILVRWDYIIKFTISENIIKFILNILLLQSLFPKHVYSFNGLSWFLSVMFILYLIALPLIILLKRLKNNKSIKIIIFILFVQNLIVFINNKYMYNIDLYINPFFRILDFIIGMLISKQMMQNVKRQQEIKLYTILELSIILLFIVMYIISIFINENLVYYSPIYILLIYIYSYQKGIVSRLLSSDILQKIAEFSFEFYMVHELIIILLKKVLNKLQYGGFINNVIICIPAFIISIMLAKAINKYITKRNLMNFKLNNEEITLN